MIALLIVASYLAVGLATWRTYVMRQVESDAQAELARVRERYSGSSYREEDRQKWIDQHIREKGLVSDFDRSEAMFSAALAALFWPLFWPAVGAIRLLSVATGDLTSPTERAVEQAAADRAELEELRKLAREHGLPMPGNDSEKGAA